MRRIAVFTSGGDAPGMNAALRAVVRTAAYYDLHVYGIERGYEGMIKGQFDRIEKRDVGNIMQRGGTILKTARSPEFMTKEGRKLAHEYLVAYDIDACIALGGNGTFTGADIFSREFNIPFIGVPCTIDNDLFGTDFTIGFDTAVNTAVEAVDKIRDTAESHNRLFFIEVMGRHSGFIALNTAIAGGAGSVLIPEKETSIETLIEKLRISSRRNKMFSIVIVAEGNKDGNANEIAQKVGKALDMFDIRVTIIGHLQRGGSPTFRDRVLASRLGNAAVKGLLEGQRNVMAGIINDKIKYTSFRQAIQKPKLINEDLLQLADILAI
ncbi:MAG: 6-phosphofructokinase [Bacteroidetes bacterium]|nr:MAG: 6-phosphofructokinase [Bacteroidota bacterium]